MLSPDKPGFETLAVHAGARPDPATGAVIPPLYRTAAYLFDDTAHAASLFNLELPGHIYSRISNPTVAVFEERMAALEGGVGGVATASGQAALHLIVATLASAGDHVVCSSAVYGGTANLFLHTLPRFGIDTTFVDPRDHQAIAAAIQPETKLVVAETIGNPTMTVIDIPAVATIAHERGVPLVVDNTFATPVLCRPIEHGADIVFHSATKFIGGHGTEIGGIVVDGGTFDWEGSGRHPTLTEPYAAYGGIDFVDAFGPAAFAVRARVEGLRDFGACMSADTAFSMTRGLESLAPRVDRHLSNARRVIAALQSSEAVSWVAHPDVADHPDRAVSARILPDGGGSILAFSLVDGREAGRRFIEAVEVFSHLANVGDVRSLVIHPASTTHQQMTADQLAAAGIDEGLVRVSVGLEDPDDLVEDLGRALRRAQAS